MPTELPAPVLGLVIDPDSEIALLRRIQANEPGQLATVVGGSIQAIEIDTGAVVWMDENGKNAHRPTNLLATKIAHRLHAGLFPDDTINGRAVVLGETVGLDGDLISADVSAATLQALAEIKVTVRPG